MTGQVGADSFFIHGKVAMGQQSPSFFVTIRNIYFFPQPSAKFLTNLSEITAPLPPTIYNYSNLKDKVSNKVGAAMGAERGQLGAEVGQKTGDSKELPPELILSFQRVDHQGAEGQSVKSVVNMFLNRVSSLVASFQYRKSSLLILSKDMYIHGQRVNTVNSLWLPCVGSRLGDDLRARKNRRILRNGLTAHSYNMCGKGISRSNKINRLEGLDSGKCAVRFGYADIEAPGQRTTPLEKYQRSGLTSPPLQYINCSYFIRVFLVLIEVLRFKVVSFVFSPVVGFQKWGAPGGFVESINFASKGMANA